MRTQLEIKDITLAKASIEVDKPSDAPDAPFTLSGYGSTFGGEPDSYGDVIAPGAYVKSLGEWAERGWPLPILFNHDPKLPIGKWVQLAEDAVGLRVSGELTPGHSLARDVAASLKHGAISGLSIGYKTRKASDGPKGVRILEDIELHELSVVTNPANVRARVTAAKSADDIKDLRDFEAALRDEFGFSNRHAKCIATHGFKFYLREVRDELAGETEAPVASGAERPGDGKAVDKLLAALRELKLTPV